MCSVIKLIRLRAFKFSRVPNFFLQAMNSNMSATDRRMTAERCAHLSLVAIAHELEEAWISLFPVVPLMYFNQYLPTISFR